MRRRVLFWNHEPCSSLVCPLAAGVYGSCQSCRHRRTDDRCGLTGSPRPAGGGCCHWNVVPLSGRLAVTPAMVTPLAGYFETVERALAGVPHELDGQTWIVPPEQVRVLQAWGVDYEVGEAGLIVDPAQFVLMVDEPVADILAGLEVPYQVEANGVWVELADLQLPTIYGQGEAASDGLQP